VEAIVEARKGGAFTDLFDFCRRVDAGKLNRRALEALIRAGALDGLGPRHHFHDRATLMANLPDALKAAEQEAQTDAAGIQDMFGGENRDGGTITVHWQEAPAWNDGIRLEGEKNTLGLFLTGHPFDQFEQEIRQFTTHRLGSLAPTAKGEQAVVAGLVVQLRITRSKKNNEQMAFLSLDDKSGRVEVSVFGKTYAKYGRLIEKDQLLVVVGSVRHDDYSNGNNVLADEIMTMTGARERYARSLVLRPRLGDGLAAELRESLQPWQGGECPVVLQLVGDKARFHLRLGSDWRITPTERLLETLRSHYGRDAVSVEY
jgi:DNA polymerase-3 subunit alpha